MNKYEKPSLAGVETARLGWRTSSYSNGAGGMCVEVAPLGHGMVVRDSKNPAGAVLAFSAAEWDAFLAGARDGEFDLRSVTA
ncbi:DUF397 domain-containing protein [Frankia sp. AgB1.9]|uniref:DUF397 domain-containing protein n=1 Tax=Pseudofrankia inefficax (strain DSM 45817 / CECT 9037 / DDB 130130 / EuI1c) TaxID=298654 RepID=E3IUQ0_PSEI1|nr:MULTISPECIES: DUF397 domain-containing protein [Frankiaceae]ADP84866.1 protein of unknown function DUF397 [Pseudofrankia inefficax]MBL7491623.1 DUF397 domain-containing protein [Frankia sp. AgW1.1]MBL7553832.1 DUF397 domain-containing protein [Frankia sp. AgB1.9]MBL7618077.1 DUF397 domain-containing protein [Frankia sp. AgB1.8]